MRTVVVGGRSGRSGLADRLAEAGAAITLLKADRTMVLELERADWLRTDRRIKWNRPQERTCRSSGFNASATGPSRYQ